MNLSPTRFYRWCCRKLRRLNYEVYLLHDDLVLQAKRSPWKWIPLACVGLMAAHAIYWVLYPTLLIVTCIAGVPHAIASKLGERT